MPELRTERLLLRAWRKSDFDNPSVSEGPLRRNVVYRLPAERWKASREDV